MWKLRPLQQQTLIGTVLVLLTLLTLPIRALGQIDLSENAPGKLDLKPTDVIHWDSAGASIAPDGTVTVNLRLRTDQNFTLYRDKVKFEGPAGYSVKSGQYPVTRTIVDPIEGKTVEVYAGGDFVLTLAGLEPWKKTEFPLSITYLGCTERICLFPFTETLQLPVFASSDNNSAAPATPETLTNSSPQTATTSNAPGPDSTNHPDLAVSTETQSATPNPANSSPANQDIEQSYASKIQKNELSYAWLLIVLFLGGLATNLTPCVFPMIPITLRLLARQGGSAIKGSILYSLGIILTYSLLGIVAAATGGLFGSLLASTTFNVVCAGLFFIFGLSMLGFGNLSGLQRVGSRLGTGSNSAANTFFMGAGAGLVAAPCTGPILGSLLTVTTKMPMSEAMLLFFAYSFGFGIPYVFLGMSATQVSKIRLSHYWQLTVKLVFAAAMFALSLYYLRIPAHQALQQMHGHWQTLTLLSLGLGTVAVLMVLFIPNWDYKKTIHLAPALFLSLGLFSTTQWLTGGDRSSIIELHWHKGEAEGMAAGKAAQKPILIDGWAEWCEACKKMDASTFQDDALRATLKNDWTLVKFDLTDLTDANEKLAEKYGLQGLPTLVLLPPNGDLAKMKKITGYVSADHLMSELNQFKKGQ